MLTLLMRPDELRAALIKSMYFKPIKISELYKYPLERYIFLPLLSNKKENENKIYAFLLNSVKVFIRTELSLKSTTEEERGNHIELFENVSRKTKEPLSKKELSSKEEWALLKSHLSQSPLLSKDLQKRYLSYLIDLEQELSNIRIWFKGNSKETIMKLLKSRLYDSILQEDDSLCKFGFSEDAIVEVESENGDNFVISLGEDDPLKLRILDWILTSEHNIGVKTVETAGKEKIYEYPYWVFNSIDTTADAIYRILNEYYSFETENNLLDFALEPTPKGKCFIATAAYGTPFAEEINILRYWRDSFLLKHYISTKFVQAYYAISPPIANLIDKRETLRYIVRKMLDPPVKLMEYYYNNKKEKKD